MVKYRLSVKNNQHHKKYLYLKNLKNNFKTVKKNLLEKIK